MHKETILYLQFNMGGTRFEREQKLRISCLNEKLRDRALLTYKHEFRLFKGY